MEICRLPPVEDSQIIYKSSWIEKLEVFQIAMDHEQYVRTNYQLLHTTLEIALISFFFTLPQFGITYMIWIFVFLGVMLCFPFGIACEYRARNVDIWRINIVRLVHKSDVETAFKEGKYQWVPYGKSGAIGGYLFGHWFERILITFLLLVWAYVSLVYPNIPWIVRFLGGIALLFWIYYAFQIIKPKGEIILPEYSNS